ncbi:hypothetical protein [uncultured Sphingomonas sp.]|uniref:hypothetical protein n=1 Tax=uncultured Sphingomonas sp. TaxID=158754 RepID=UPI0035CC98CD
MLQHQAEILGIIRRSEAMLAHDVRDVPGLARARWALVRALTAYQLFKHREVFDPMLAKARPAEAHRLAEMKRTCTAMGEAFRLYVQKWSATDVGGQWDEYQQAAHTMIARIRTHMAGERANVTAILSQDGPIRPPADVPRCGDRPRPAG